jgi:hypothetical protein
MRMRLDFALVAASVLAASVAVSTLSFAQQQGTTSGPAVGTPVVPGTAAQKENSAGGAGSSGSTSVQQGAVGVGAPGATAKPGTEGGPSPAPGTTRRQ